MLDRKVLLLLIFLFALVLRFLYFPQNTYFGFDQARDAYAVREILSGNLKVVGPPTANGIFHHGVLYYYIFAPFYFFSGGDPAAVSIFLRILNATGVFLLYGLVLPIFGPVAAMISAFLFAVSYEQTQFSLFLNHPALAVISVLIFYFGLAYWIFRKRDWGFFTALFGLGLSIQFEFVEIQLIAPFILMALFFYKKLPKINFKNIVFALFAFLLPVFSYILAEMKSHFIVFPGAGQASDFPRFLFFINRHIHDNLTANNFVSLAAGLGFLAVTIYLIYKKVYIKQLLFLSVWFFGGLLVYFVTNDTAYFYNTGTSISLLIFASFFLSKLYSKNKSVIIPILILVMLSNLYLITKNNPMGPNTKINPQIGLLLKDEQRVIDYIYKKARGEKFAVNALTMPYNINTTWSYLFEWYGRGKYGYTPVWGGDAALGYPGNLRVETARSKLPVRRFLIIEPWENVIPSYMVDGFIRNEENYAAVVEKKQIGEIKIWVQEAK